ncbi:hypothetical protein ABH920_007518 [Catenulispora sp. EB89]|uniref:hypothetical protein n=1 Tax=Catenulispora sp. EB89 TaxID=3156257 RepID=UPI003518ED39
MKVPADLEDHAGIAKVDHVMAAMEKARGDYPKAPEHVRISLVRSESAPGRERGRERSVLTRPPRRTWTITGGGDRPRRARGQRAPPGSDTEVLGCYRRFSEVWRWRKIVREREAMSQGSAARRAWETALMLFEEVQLPDADEIRESFSGGGGFGRRQLLTG